MQIRNALASIVALSLALCGVPAFAAPATGTGGALNTLSCKYYATPPTLTDGQVATVACDINGKLANAPASLVFGSAIPTLPSTGVGGDTVFPTTVSTSGTSLGTLPTGASKTQIHLPPGSSVSLYVAATIATNATAAALVSETYANASGNTNNLDVSIDLNGNQQVWVTNYTSGTASTYISGKPVYRFL